MPKAPTRRERARTTTLPDDASVFVVHAHGGYPQHGPRVTIPDGCYAVHRAPFGTRELHDAKADDAFIRETTRRPHSAVRALASGRLLRYHTYGELAAEAAHTLRNRTVFGRPRPALARRPRGAKLPSAARLRPSCVGPGSSVPDKFLQFTDSDDTSADDPHGGVNVYGVFGVNTTAGAEAFGRLLRGNQDRTAWLSEVMACFGPGIYICMTCSVMIEREPRAPPPPNSRRLAAVARRLFNLAYDWLVHNHSQRVISECLRRAERPLIHRPADSAERWKPAAVSLQYVADEWCPALQPTSGP
jgi:hypothetical protein